MKIHGRPVMISLKYIPIENIIIRVILNSENQAVNDVWKVNEGLF